MIYNIVKTVGLLGVFGLLVWGYKVLIEQKNIPQVSQAKEVLFEDRMIYFDRAMDREENILLLKKVILKAQKLGFNKLVLNQEYLYTRLSHKNPIIDKVRKNMGEIEKLAHAHGLEVVVMHFNAEVANTVVHDKDPANRFNTKGMFDFSEANKAITHYLVLGDKAVVDRKTFKVDSKGLFDSFYHFKGIKPNTEYKLTMTASTQNYAKDSLKISVLDEDYHGENGKVLFGIQKYFRGISSSKTNGKYSVYFNSLNHKNLGDAFKVVVAKGENISVEYLALQEVGYTKEVHVLRAGNEPLVQAGGRVYKEGIDYRFEEDKIALLSKSIQGEKSLDVTWYPRVDVSRFYDHVTTADICADEPLYHDIFKDQYAGISKALHGNIDALAFNDDEWREAGWDKKCEKLYAKEFKEMGRNQKFTGGDYIGISTRRMIETLRKEADKADMPVYIMSDMFDPNFNAKDPFMGVKDDALGGVAYLPKNIRVFNWFPNPYEPGLEDKTMDDFLQSAKFFSDQNISQVIAGYHDDMRNLDSNIAIYRDSDVKTKKSIVGFMFLIWHQYGKSPSYDHMDLVVDKFCKELPGKWPQSGCEAVVIP